MKAVAPFTGAWIEIDTESDRGDVRYAASHPSRVRGLKYETAEYRVHLESVAPFTGAWIEIEVTNALSTALQTVAPFTGAWIEIFFDSADTCVFCLSHPSRVRGLKSDVDGCFTDGATSHPSRVRGLK